MHNTEATSAIATLTGHDVVRIRPLAGHVLVADLADGTVIVAKRDDRPEAASAEITSLAWLAETGARTPAVRGHDSQWVILDHVPEGRPTAAAAEALGHSLATMHRAGTDAFGTPPPGGPTDAVIGNAPMRNIPGLDWPAWYAEHRIAPYVRLAIDSGALASARPFDQVRARIHELAGPSEPPARLHGDLWSGNVLWGSDGHAWLIDPAAHGGHRETDLAMLRLFGYCPHLDRILAAYRETAPLAPGWQARIPLHQLFPLLVHAALFGSGYARQATAAAEAALRI